jgi:hypothetical protein
MAKPTLAAIGGFSQRMRAPEACKYLDEKYGIKHTTKSLANRRAKRLPPQAEYQGASPTYTSQSLDTYAATAFTKVSPHALAAERRKAAGLPPPKGIGRPRKKDRQAKTEASERPRSPPAE